jgi:hypothetical protein
VTTLSIKDWPYFIMRILSVKVFLSRSEEEIELNRKANHIHFDFTSKDTRLYIFYTIIFFYWQIKKKKYFINN